MNLPLNVHYEDTLDKHPDLSLPDPHQDSYSKNSTGFWMYLMTDALLFLTLFASYAVYKIETFGGPTSQDLFSLSTAFTETILLLLSSLSCGFAMLAAIKDRPKRVLGWLGITFILGAAFLAIELKEFVDFFAQGASWSRSAFLSSFFALVSTHGLHISVGLFWILVLAAQIIYQGVTSDTFRRLALFSMFWHFLDLVWIFIFTFVYLLGVI